ncbi:glycosyl transferase group 1 protein [Nitzschia inconspicua]|uniref:Alpha-1,3/1,6-mannosyltransferase ALG2 n=1 Tax=Nitzschia inconspicua TaxID=303405 RepID=A0A9K3PWP4_9STRA|nr:glycosyl transferase group 1 protein [Nitzschia inconspicua]KAG7362156.1 glycosyl transferase group 1 protein [Nitzschia inconspicua]
MTSGDNNDQLHIVFVHLDLGIGGAEQLVLQLATASQDLGYRVDLVTTRCDQDHCFAAVHQPEGRLSSNVYVYGRWIPSNVLGMGTALMSTLRMLYITYQVTRLPQHKTAHVVVMDVLPTSLPLLLQWLPSAGILFYCHFPDKLLLRSRGGRFKQWYRRILDSMEESTMGLADTLVVNSKFTLSQVRQHFTSFSSRKDIGVLYPALDTSNMVQANHEKKSNQSPIVSLNRFERKKNVGLLIEAYAYMRQRDPKKVLPPLIIAGGYDTQNVENVEYRGELGQLAKTLNVSVDFRLDISDGDRAILFQTALCVVYTPDKEHFGIVPLEAMFAGTPVLAVNSGGPTETIVDGETGFLRSPTAQDFGDALLTLIDDPSRATTMGIAGREHVEKTFGPKRFEKEWKGLVDETKKRGVARKNGNQQHHVKFVLWMNVSLYLLEAALALLLVTALTWLAQQSGILKPSQSILGKVRSHFQHGEL